MIHNDLPQPGPVEESQPRGPGHNRTGNHLHARAARLGARIHRAEHCCCERRYRSVRWTHNALKPHYRGWDGANANHNYNWHDSIHDSVGNPCGNDSPVPLRRLLPRLLIPPAQRSATTAWVTRSGWRPAQSGLAAVTWTRATAHRPDTSSAWNFSLRLIHSTARRIEGDPTKAPDITINSWGCPTSEGCSTGDELQAAVEAQEAAGIQMVVAAGNSRSGLFRLVVGSARRCMRHLIQSVH